MTTPSEMRDREKFFGDSVEEKVGVKLPSLEGLDESIGREKQIKKNEDVKSMTTEEMIEKMNEGPITPGEMKEILSSTLLDAEMDEWSKSWVKNLFDLYCELGKVGESNEIDLDDFATFIENCTNQKGEYLNRVADYFDEAIELEKDGIYTSFSMFDKDGNQVMYDAYIDASSLGRVFFDEVREIKFIHYIAAPDIKKIKEVSMIYANEKIEISSTFYHHVDILADIHKLAEELSGIMKKHRETI